MHSGQSVANFMLSGLVVKKSIACSLEYEFLWADIDGITLLHAVSVAWGYCHVKISYNFHHTAFSDVMIVIGF